LPSIFFTSDHRLRPIWRFVLAVLVFFAAEYLAAALASFLPGRRPLLFNLLFELFDLALLLAGFSFLLIFVDGVDGPPLPAMGLSVRRPGTLREAFTGLAVGGSLVITAFLILVVTGSVSSMLYNFSSRHVVRAVAVFALLAFGAMSEEVAFRGYPFQRLIEAIGIAPALIFVSLLFGGLHASNPHATVWGVLNTALFGVLASIAYLRTRALWLPWGVHFGWNLTLGLVLGLPVSGLSLFSVLGRTTVSGPTWLTGGDYGIEGSATGTAAMVLGIVVVLACTRSRATAEPVPASNPSATLGV
jgi:uncharacterized protein